MTEWHWLTEAVVLAIHDEQLAEHGGLSGVRDLGLLQSALLRPINRAAYGDPDVADLAAAYAFGIIRNHPFLDGNKRVGFVAAAAFLLDHGYEITAEDTAILTEVLRLSDGTMTEDAFAAWLRQNGRRAC